MLRDRGLQFFHVNEEFPVSASHQLALITSLPFVHTARRYYRLNDRSEVFGLDARNPAPPGAGSSRDREDDRTRPFRGSKSRNKVSVGEPAEGSLENGPAGPAPPPHASGVAGRFGARPIRTRGRARSATCVVFTHALDRPPARRDPPTERLREKAPPGVPRGRPAGRRARPPPPVAETPDNTTAMNNARHPTPNGGSLGSWIDEDRSYLRVVV